MDTQWIKTPAAPARLALLVWMLALAAGAQAQKANTWKGGTPGQETNWNCPQNWSTNAVPDAFSDVVIPDVSTSTFAAPVIRTGTHEVNALLLLSGARLTIEADANLIVLMHLEIVPNAVVQGKGLLLFQEENGGLEAGTASGGR
ncbi:MAG: hypothetical protein SFV52_08165 [Saprospiraceae bacterium]|nr:hypothetical protein [Saprospiraceae bacterium]